MADVTWKRHTDDNWRDRLVWALMTGLLTAGAGWLATRAAQEVWTRVVKRPPPPREGLAAVLGWMVGQRSVGALTH